MTPLPNQSKSLQYFSIVCVVAVIGLLTIWVLPNTIALRHIFLGAGLIGSIAVILKTEFFKNRSLAELAPLILFSMTFIWVLVHYSLFSLNPELELQELKSIWLRALVGSIVAIGLSISLRINTLLQPYFFISLFVVSGINLGAYLYLSYKTGAFILPADFVTAFVFKKIEAGFFGVMAIAISCANLLYLLAKNNNNGFIIFFWIFGICIAVTSSLVANTKNGVAVALGLCLLLGLTLIVKALVNKNKSNFSMLLTSLMVFLLLFSGWKVHSRFATQGWETLLEDAKISSQLDQHNYWRYNSHFWNKVVGEKFPKNSLGINVAGNTYERVAWATQGIKLIANYPMGYGSINRSFIGMLNHANIRQELESQTHSGWIDFGLAFGLPGLLILYSTFISIVLMGIFSRSQFGLMGLWLILGIVPFGVIAEICYKHNFEILIFLIAFSATSVVSYGGVYSKNRNH